MQVGMTEQERIVEEFSTFDEWMDKYQHLIDLGKALPKMNESEKIPENLIKGCQSNLYLSSTFRDGKLYFSASGDALIAQGIVALLLKIFNGKTPEEILNADLSFLDKIGLRANLSPTRANGLRAMISRITELAKNLKHGRY